MTDFQPDYLELFRLQAQKAGLFPMSGPETLNVYIAPTEVSGRLTALILRSWEGIPGIRHSVVTSEAEALDVLGLSARTIADLREHPA